MRTREFCPQYQKRCVVLVVGTAVIVGFGAIIASWNHLVEQWYLRKLENSESLVETADILDVLSVVGGSKTAQRLIEQLATRIEDGATDGPSPSQTVLDRLVVGTLSRARSSDGFIEQIIVGLRSDSPWVRTAAALSFARRAVPGDAGPLLSLVAAWEVEQDDAVKEFMWHGIVQQRENLRQLRTNGCSPSVVFACEKLSAWKEAQETLSYSYSNNWLHQLNPPIFQNSEP